MCIYIPLWKLLGYPIWNYQLQSKVSGKIVIREFYSKEYLPHPINLLNCIFLKWHPFCFLKEFLFHLGSLLLSCDYPSKMTLSIVLCMAVQKKNNLFYCYCHSCLYQSQNIPSYNFLLSSNLMGLSNKAK